MRRSRRTAKRKARGRPCSISGPAQRAARLAGLNQLVQARTEYGLRLGDWANAQLICREFMRRDPADQDAPAWLEKIRERSVMPTR